MPVLHFTQRRKHFCHTHLVGCKLVSVSCAGWCRLEHCPARALVGSPAQQQHKTSPTTANMVTDWQFGHTAKPPDWVCCACSKLQQGTRWRCKPRPLKAGAPVPQHLCCYGCCDACCLPLVLHADLHQLLAQHHVKLTLQPGEGPGQHGVRRNGCSTEKAAEAEERQRRGRRAGTVVTADFSNWCGIIQGACGDACLLDLSQSG